MFIMAFHNMFLSVNKNGFKSPFYIGLGILFLVFGLGQNLYSGSLPIMLILMVGGSLIAFGKAFSVIAVQFLGLPRQQIFQVYSQFCVLVVVNLVGFWSLCSYFFIDEKLLHDTHTFYNNFHDNLQSLNYFGEPAWWYPNVQHGFPGYFLALLVNVNTSSPPFIMLGSVFYFLGKVGITITNILPVYVWYFGFIIPFIFSLSIWLLARQILTSTVALTYICIVGTVSPGLILNFTDAGLIEIAAYGFFLATAYLKFIKVPKKRNFSLLILAVAILCVTIGYAFLAFVFIFLIAFLLVRFVPSSSACQVKAALSLISLKSWLALVVVIGICATPALLTMSQRGDLERTTLADNPSPYQFMTRGFGNPLEALMASTPGVGVKGVAGSVLYPVMDGAEGWSFYGYLGLLAIPLALIGFIYSRSYWRVRLLILAVLYYSVIILQNYSPIFFPVLSTNSILTSISHFNDLSYRSGGFILILLTAGLGLEALHERRVPQFVAPTILLLSLSAAAVLLYSLKSTSVFVFGFLLGFLVLLGVSYFTLFCWIVKTKPGHQNQKLFFSLLLAVTVIDVLTISHLHIRTNFFSDFSGIQRTHDSLDTQNSDHVGLKNIYVNAQATTTLQARTYIDLQKIRMDLNTLPESALFTRYHVSQNISQADIDSAISGASLAVSPESNIAETLQAINKSLVADVRNGVLDKIAITQKNYNSVTFSVTAAKPSLFFWRDARHPYWNAEVNGREAEVLTALGHYKAVTLSAGPSVLKFWFAPRGVALSLIVAYCVILFLVAFITVEFIRSRRAD
jgi:hypothetical protein